LKSRKQKALGSLESGRKGTLGPDGTKERQKRNAGLSLPFLARSEPFTSGSRKPSFQSLNEASNRKEERKKTL
jgi:hypothetical protein